MVDPRFTRTASVADIYAPIRSGTDITFLSGVLLYLISNNKINAEYVKNYTNASLLVRDDFTFEDGLFSGYDESKRQYDKLRGTTSSTKMAMPNAMTPCSIRAACGIC